jgi:hypothetical protein
LRPIGGGALSNAHTHTEGEGAASTQTASQHALQETQRDRSKALGVSALEQETYALSSPDAPTHPSHQSTSTAPSQPAMWPCQITYDTRQLRSIGGGALSNAMRTEGEGAASTQTASQHALQETQRDRSKAQGVNTLEQETYALSSPDAHTPTPIPPIQQHSTKPCGRVR